MIYFHVFLSWNETPKLFFRSRIKSLRLLKVLPFFSSCVQSLHKLVYTGLYAQFGLGASLLRKGQPFFYLCKNSYLRETFP